MTVFWTVPAIHDLEDIHDYIARDSVYFAERQIEKILDCEYEISTYPKSGRLVPEYNNDMIREVFIDN